MQVSNIKVLLFEKVVRMGVNYCNTSFVLMDVDRELELNCASLLECNVERFPLRISL